MIPLAILILSEEKTTGKLGKVLTLFFMCVCVCVIHHITNDRKSWLSWLVPGRAGCLDFWFMESWNHGREEKIEPPVLP